MPDLNSNNKERINYKIFYKDGSSEYKLLTREQYKEHRFRKENVKKVKEVDREIMNKKDLKKVLETYRETLRFWEGWSLNEELKVSNISEEVRKYLTQLNNKSSYFREFDDKIFQEEMWMSKTNFLELYEKNHYDAEAKFEIINFSKSMQAARNKIKKIIIKGVTKTIWFLLWGGLISLFFFIEVLPQLQETLPSINEESETLALIDKLSIAPYIPIVIALLILLFVTFIKFKSDVFWKFIKKHFERSGIFDMYRRMNTLKLFNIMALADVSDIEITAQLLEEEFFFFEWIQTSKNISFKSLSWFLNKLTKKNTKQSKNLRSYFHSSSLNTIHSSQTSSSKKKLDAYTQRAEGLKEIVLERVENLDSKISIVSIILGVMAILIGAMGYMLFIMLALEGSTNIMQQI